MLVSKSFIVVGNTTTRNGESHKDIAEKVDAAINEFLSNLGSGKLVDLKPNVQITPTTDTAFITIIVDVEKVEKKEEPVKHIFSKKK